MPGAWSGSYCGAGGEPAATVTEHYTHALAARSNDTKPPEQPAAELIVEASSVIGVTEHETALLTAAQRWLAWSGDVPAGLREELWRIVFVRHPERKRA